MPKVTEEKARPGMPVPSSAGTQEEAAWQAWLAKGRLRDRQGGARRIQALKMALIAILLALAAFWAKPGQFDIALRFVVAAGALALMVQAFRARSYLFAGVFGLMVWLYNPVAPVFSFAGDLQRALVLATSVPLILSLMWDKPKQAAQ